MILEDFGQLPRSEYVTFLAVIVQSFTWSAWQPISGRQLELFSNSESPRHDSLPSTSSLCLTLSKIGKSLMSDIDVVRPDFEYAGWMDGWMCSYRVSESDFQDICQCSLVAMLGETLADAESEDQSTQNGAAVITPFLFRRGKHAHSRRLY